MTIDDTLAALGAAEVHPRLSMIDEGVFARIDVAQGRRRARRGMAAMIGAAMLVGVAGAALPSGPSSDQSAGFSPIALAPSTLLGGEG